MGPQLLVEPGKATFFSSGSLSTLSQSDFWSFASRTWFLELRLPDLVLWRRRESCERGTLKKLKGPGFMYGDGFYIGPMLKCMKSGLRKIVAAWSATSRYGQPTCAAEASLLSFS
jgi:hypothetical protein